MIISDSQRFIFLHNPKCAGTTVRRSLMKHETRSNFYWMMDKLDGKVIDKAHMPLSIFKKFAPRDYELLDEYFVFGFVRDPYKRFLSAFNETHRQMYREFSEGVITLESYAKAVNEFCAGLNERNVVGWHIKYRHLIPQHSIYYSGNKCIADLIMPMEIISDASFRLAAFSPFLSEVATTWSEPKNAKNVKKVSVPLEAIISEKSFEHLSRIYDRDFQIFGYKQF